MTSLTVAGSFLAGSLLSLLLPVILLVALAVWYMLALKRIPDTRSKEADATALGVDPSAPSPTGEGAAPGGSA